MHVFTKKISEEIPNGIHMKEAAEFLARRKHAAYKAMLKDHVVITADTTVLCNQQLLEKPQNHGHAVEMLESLSGNFNDVISGVCIGNDQRLSTFSCTTRVYFRELTSTEIKTYIDVFKPFDKAGAYGIQEWIGMIGIQRIEGSYYNVMGLPIDLVYQALVNEFSIHPVLKPE